MNYTKKRQLLLDLMNEARNESDVIRNTIAKADNAAKTDIRHAHGILDRLSESEYCKTLRKEIKQ